MTFEFVVQPGFDFVKSFGEKFSIPVFNNGVKIPAHMGEGHIRMIDVEPGFKFVLHHYTLKESFHLKRMSPPGNNELISIVFNSNEIPIAFTDDRDSAMQFININGSSIQIASTAFDKRPCSFIKIFAKLIGKTENIANFIEVDHMEMHLNI